MTSGGKGRGRVWAGVRKAGRVVLPNPARAVGAAPIGDGYRLIKTYWTRLREVQAARAALDGIARASGRGDLMAEGESLGLSPGEVVRRMESGRTRTRARAFFALALSGLAFLSWAWNMVAGGLAAGHWLGTLYYLGFALAAGLSAFRYGWLNWQLRRGRRGTAAEYLTTDEGFWPS